MRGTPEVRKNSRYCKGKIWYAGESHNYSIYFHFERVTITRGLMSFPLFWIMESLGYQMFFGYSTNLTRKVSLV